MAKAIYKIQIKSWDKHNGTLKKGHKKILLSTGFLTDSKIMMLPPGGKLLFLGLLLRCGELTSSLIECSHDHLVMLAGGSGHVVSRLLDQMQSLQLLTFEKIDPFLDRREKNRKEEKIIERKMGADPEANPPGPQDPSPDPTETGQSDLPFLNFILNDVPESTADPSADFDLGMLGPKGANPVISSLQGFPHLEHALSWVPRNTQRRWASSYTDTFELRKSLAKAVEHISASFIDGPPRELTKWSVWLDGWLAKDKTLKKGMPGDNSTPELTVESLFGKAVCE